MMLTLATLVLVDALEGLASAVQRDASRRVVRFRLTDAAWSPSP